MRVCGRIALALLFLAAACARTAKAPQAGVLFEDDAAFLRQHTRVVFLGTEGGPRVAVNPDLQGRIMTSTAGGREGLSFGWINRELLASGRNDPHMNAFGGEDRFWLGPEGGQFSIFFKAGAPFDLDHWYTPPPLNEGSFDVVARDAASIEFKKAIHLVNYSETAFDLEVGRAVRLLDKERLAALGLALPEGLPFVAFESENRVTNTGARPWIRETGLLSIWILGQFNPSPETTIVIPFKPGPESDLGPFVNDAYFGKVPSDRLIVKEAEGVLFFKGDGKYRSKIGISPLRVKPFLGSYDAANKVLTIVHFTVPGNTADYVNSMWQIQEKPYGGDAANSYNDGPASPGAKPLGPFYELESSSPALALGPGQTAGHTHTTMHFQGDEKLLDGICRAALGVGLEEVKAAFTAGR
jgi:hypothetical protein